MLSSVIVRSLDKLDTTANRIHKRTYKSYVVSFGVLKRSYDPLISCVTCTLCMCVRYIDIESWGLAGGEGTCM